MSTDLRQLYQEVLIDHAKRPRNFHEIAGAKSVDGYNPLCGDRIRLYVSADGGKIKALAFTGSGCAISTASASMMTDAVKGKTLAETQHLFERFHELVTADPSKAAAAGAELGKLAVFAGVHEFPMRVKCASLAWHTMKAALEGGSKATTE